MGGGVLGTHKSDQSNLWTTLCKEVPQNNLTSPCCLINCDLKQLLFGRSNLTFDQNSVCTLTSNPYGVPFSRNVSPRQAMPLVSVARSTTDTNTLHKTNTGRHTHACILLSIGGHRRRILFEAGNAGAPLVRRVRLRLGAGWLLAGELYFVFSV